MKNIVRVVAVGVAVLVGAQTASAQTGVSLGLGGGAAVPTGSMADGAKDRLEQRGRGSGEACCEPGRPAARRVL
jgi:hypothetical protein